MFIYLLWLFFFYLLQGCKRWFSFPVSDTRWRCSGQTVLRPQLLPHHRRDSPAQWEVPGSAGSREMDPAPFVPGSVSISRSLCPGQNHRTVPPTSGPLSLFWWHTFILWTVSVLQEDEYEWGSSSILDALPSINSQQRRLALAAMRWRKALHGRSKQGVNTIHIHLYRVNNNTTDVWGDIFELTFSNHLYWILSSWLT